MRTPIYNSKMRDAKGRDLYECDFCKKLSTRNYGIEIHYTNGGGEGSYRRCACKECFDLRIKPLLQVTNRMLDTDLNEVEREGARYLNGGTRR